jgi:hypothetical protein
MLLDIIQCLMFVVPTMTGTSVSQTRGGKVRVQKQTNNTFPKLERQVLTVKCCTVGPELIALVTTRISKGQTAQTHFKKPNIFGAQSSNSLRMMCASFDRFGALRDVAHYGARILDGRPWLLA